MIFKAASQTHYVIFLGLITPSSFTVERQCKKISVSLLPWSDW